MIDRELPCLVFEGPPKLILWPKVTLEVLGRQVTVDALGRIGERDPQWFVAEIGPNTRHPMGRVLDVPVVAITRQDVLSPRCLERVLAKIQRALPRQAA